MLFVQSELLEGVVVEAPTDPSNTDTNNSFSESNKSRKRILLRFRIIESENSSVNETSKENSVALQSILQESVGPKDGNSTISVIWNMRDNVKYVQNLMGWILDLIESFKNILNWTAPNKTYPIYLALLGIWLLTIVIPGIETFLL